MTPLEQRQCEFAGYLITGFPNLGLPGLPGVSADAITGNATQENEVLPVTAGPKDHGSDGVLQWRLTRLTKMKDYCVKNFGRWDTLKAQAAFTLKETRDGYPALWADLVAGKKSIDTLTADFCFMDENPNRADANLDRRIAAAKATRRLRTGATSVSGKAGTVAAASGSAAAVSHAAGFPWWVTALVGIAALIAGILIATKVKK